MVGPSTTESERAAGSLYMQAGFVLLVAGSAGLIALQGDASLVEVGLVALLGAAFGAVLLYYLVWAGWKSADLSGRR